MKTIISIGFALIAGWAMIGQGTASAQSNTDGYAFNPYTMSAKPLIQDKMTGGASVLIRLPERITPEDAFPQNPNAWYSVPTTNGNIDAFPNNPNSAYSQPNNDPNLDAMPKYPTATWVVQYHKPY